MARTPSSMAPSTQSNSEDSPASWPAVRGRPRSLAHRPLPSMTIATCRGTRSAGIGGGVAPDGWGLGAFTCRGAPTSRLTQQARLPPRRDVGAVDERQGPQAALEVPLQQGRDQAAALPALGVLAGL